jgi:hypothetical protein
MFVELDNELVENGTGDEIACSMQTHIFAGERLDSMDGVQVRMQTCIVGVVLDALPTRWKSFHLEARHAITDERRAGPNTDRRATCQQNLLRCQRAVIIVGQVSTGSRSACRIESLLTAVATVVDLNLPWEQLGKVLKQSRPMAVLGVDQQVVFVWEWLAGQG